MDIDNLEIKIDKFIEDPNFFKLKKASSELKNFIMHYHTNRHKHKNHMHACSLLYDVISWNRVDLIIEVMPKIKKSFISIMKKDISTKDLVDFRYGLASLKLRLVPID